MTIRKLLVKASQKLKDKSPSANLDAEIILNQILKTKNQKCDRTWLYTNPDYELSKFELKQFQKLLARRLKGEPIAYITSNKEFYGLDFFVNRHVLIPRPETEIIVEHAIRYTCPEYSRGVGENPSTGLEQGKKILVGDIGTGSGCIAISIAKNCPRVKIIASDISQQALSVARKNAEKHKVESKIKFQIGKDYGENKFDVILANLPYLIKNQIKKDLKFESQKALSGGTDGLNIYRTVLPKIKNNLAKKYLIIFECAPNQISKLKRIVKENLSDDSKCRNSDRKRWNNDPHFKTLKDLAGKNRFLKISPNRQFYTISNMR